MTLRGSPTEERTPPNRPQRWGLPQLHQGRAFGGSPVVPCDRRFVQESPSYYRRSLQSRKSSSQWALSGRTASDNFGGTLAA